MDRASAPNLSWWLAESTQAAQHHGCRGCAAARLGRTKWLEVRGEKRKEREKGEREREK